MDKNEIRAENISLICLLRTLKKNLWMIAAAAEIFAMLVSLYADFVRKPVYRAGMTYAVTSRMSGYSTRNITAAKELASILTEVLDNRIVNDTIRASSEELRGYSGGIKAKLVENSNFVVVTSESGSQREAFLALVALKDNFDTISDYISSNIVAQVIQEPRVSSSPVNSMNVRRTAMKAALIGAVLMAAAIVEISVMSETVQTRSGAKSLIDAPVIAMLGHEKGARKKKRRGAGAILINSPAVSLAYTEQINSLCSRIEHEKREKGGGIVLAPDQEMGVSMVGWTAKTAFDHTGVYYNQDGLTVLPAYIQKASRLGLPALYLPDVPDVDTIADLYHNVTLVQALEYCGQFQSDITIPHRTAKAFREMGFGDIRVMPNELRDDRSEIDIA